MSKNVIFIADSLDSAHKFQKVLSGMDVNVHVGSSMQLDSLLSKNGECDLVIFEVGKNSGSMVADVGAIVSERTQASLLFIVSESGVGELRLPKQPTSDFIVQGATEGECKARIENLLWQGSEPSSQDVVSVDNMTMNLATYQVKVGDEPLDLTYLEYALLAFLVTHPGRTYSRDTLLSRVWGFDYYGGSRTVDVHVRRVRAKLGPELAQHLETVRGVGYLWN